MSDDDTPVPPGAPVQHVVSAAPSDPSKPSKGAVARAQVAAILRPSVIRGLWDYLAGIEGEVPWMYVDNKSLVTTGIGNKFEGAVDAANQPFRMFPMGADTRYATRAEIIAEYQKLSANPSSTLDPKKRLSDCGGGSADAKAAATMYLEHWAIEDLFFTVVKQKAIPLYKLFPDLPTWPADAQFACLAVCWGVGGCESYPSLKKHLKKGPHPGPDYFEAAYQCGMQPDSDDGLVAHNMDDLERLLNAEVLKQWGASDDVLAVMLSNPPPYAGPAASAPDTSATSTPTTFSITNAPLCGFMNGIKHDFGPSVRNDGARTYGNQRGLPLIYRLELHNSADKPKAVTICWSTDIDGDFATQTRWVGKTAGRGWLILPRVKFADQKPRVVSVKIVDDQGGVITQDSINSWPPHYKPPTTKP